MSNTFNKINNIENARLFLSMMNNNRFTDKSTWCNIGKILYNIEKGKQTGLTVWIVETQKALGDNFEVNECFKYYPSFENKNPTLNTLTIRTLAYYALQDNPEKYNEWHRKWCDKAKSKFLSSNRNHKGTYVCDYIYRINWLNIAGIFDNETLIYRFENGRWIYMDWPETVRFITDSVRSTSVMEGDNDMIIKTIKSCYESEELLLDFELYFNVYGLGFLDNNDTLFSVANGVFELFDNNIILREPKPEDYISLSSNIHYESLSWSHNYVEDCMNLFRTLFNNESDFRNFMKILSSTLFKDFTKTIHCFKITDNYLELYISQFLREVFGDYYSHNPLFIHDISECHSLKGKKISFNSSNNGTINSTNIKIIKSNDSLFHYTSGCYNLSLPTLIGYNDKISIDRYDISIKRRLNFIKFKHSSNAKFKNIKHLAPSFLWILVQYYPIYLRENILYHPIDDNDIIIIDNNN